MVELLGMKHIRYTLLTLLVVGTFSVSFTSIFAASNPIDDFCASSIAQSDANARAQCDDLKSLQDSNTKIKGEKDSIENEIKDIDNQIKIAQQKIKVQTTIISKLSADIGVKSRTVETLQAKIDRNIESLTSLLKQTNLKDSSSLIEVLLGNRKFSDFYTEVDAYSTLNREITSLVNDVKSTKVETETERQNLEDRKDKETDAKVAIEEQKRLIDRKKADKALLLKVKTSEYSVAQKLLSSQQQKVAQIRAKLFKFQDGEGIPFGDAYDFAAKAAQKTAVRPAFLLAILTQESSYDSEDSSFGKNIGQCFLRDTNTGSGVGANTGTFKDRVMNPTRDVPVFINISNQLGRDWMNTRVSCALSYGYGGAMGAAQFIPSTWALYGGYPSPLYTYNQGKDRIRNVFGLNEPSNPFFAEHAISASSLYLSDLGAGLQTYSSEKNAACRYYSGSKCPSGKKYYTKKERDIIAYGTNVADRAIRIQETMIDPILGK